MTTYYPINRRKKVRKVSLDKCPWNPNRDQAIEDSFQS
jgi:hypothetical protein